MTERHEDDSCGQGNLGRVRPSRREAARPFAAVVGDLFLFNQEMAVKEGTLLDRLSPAVGLAAVRSGVVRSDVAMNPILDAVAKLQRAKERLYVLCQLGGWGVFLILQLGFSRAFADRSGPVVRDTLTDTALTVMVILMGLALTHWARPLMARWGWKQLGWRALVPRVLLMAAGLSFFWSLWGYGYSYGVVGLPWPSKYSPWLIFVVSLLNGSFLMIGWLCVYFFYHIFERLQRMQI